MSPFSSELPRSVFGIGSTHENLAWNEKFSGNATHMRSYCNKSKDTAIRRIRLTVLITTIMSNLIDSKTIAEVVSTLTADFSASVNISTNSNTRNGLRIPTIHDLSSLDRHLPLLATKIYRDIGSQHSEWAYQQCLKFLLRKAGCHVVVEATIRCMYDVDDESQEEVTTKRADLIVTTATSKEKAVLELKAVSTGLSPAHLSQLEFYRDALDIGVGYLVNFPHDLGYPVVDEDSSSRISVLSGASALDLSTMNPRRIAIAKREVQVIRVDRIPRTDEDRGHAGGDGEEKINYDHPQWGVTKAGLYCKTCRKWGRRCKLHPRLAPNSSSA